MKLLFESLDVMLVEVAERKVEAVRVARVVHVDSSTGIPHLTTRVVVTAAIAGGLWAEGRYRVGRAPAETGERGFRLPPRLEERASAALAEIAARVASAGFQVRDGVYTHDRGTLDSFRL